MILMDEMIPMRLYSSKQRAYLPFNPANKKKGAMVTLLTKNMEDSIELINTSFFHNPSYFISYYMERNVKLYLSSDGNIKIEGEDEDPDETIQEAVIHAYNPDAPQIECYGTNNDERLLNQYFSKKAFNKWFDYFRIGKSRRHYPVVYGFNSLSDMFKAVGSQAIEEHGKVICNSYNTSTEIFVLNSSEYNLTRSDGPYPMYCEAAVITYICSTFFSNCSWDLANQTATALSGQAKYLTQADNFNPDETKVGMANVINRMIEVRGRNGVINLLKVGNYVPLLKFGAKDFIMRMAAKLPKDESTAIQESSEFKHAEYNIDKWGKGNPILFITGMSGSGKSTLARDLCNKKHAQYISLDHFSATMRKGIDFFKSKKTDWEDWHILNAYFTTYPEKFNEKLDSFDSDKHRELVLDYIYWLMANYSSSSERYVVEGVHIYKYMNPITFKDAPLIIMTTSPYTSAYKRVIRDMDIHMSKNPDNGVVDNVKMYFTLLRSTTKIYGTEIPEIKMFKQGIDKFREEYQIPETEDFAILESDGNHLDAVRVYKRMDEKDQKFISVDGSYQRGIANKNCIYRHIERGDGFLDNIGFIEAYTDINDSASIVIGVDPRHRGEGVATRMMERMLKEFHKENPKVSELYWRADAKNRKSQALAEKFGFKLIRKSSIQYVYRYEYKENKEYAEIPDEIIDEKSIIKYCRSHFTLDTTPANKNTKLHSVPEILKAKTVSRLDVGYFVLRCLEKIGLSCAMCLFAEHNGTIEGMGDVVPCTIFSYDTSDGAVIIADPFNKKLSSGGFAKIKYTDIFTLYEKLHGEYFWGDVYTHKYIFQYNPFRHELTPGANVYDDILHIQRLVQEHSFLEFTTHNKFGTLEDKTKKTPLRLSRLKKLDLNDETIEKYKSLMPGLSHVRTLKSCHGYLWVDSNNNDTPVCYYNAQKKPDHTGQRAFVVWLQAIEVAEDYQGRGLAKQVLDIAFSEDHITNLAVDKNNEVALHLYRNCGFKQYCINGDMVNMQLESVMPTANLFISPSDPGVMMMENQMYVFTEELSQTSYNTKLRQYLYKDRIRTSTDQIAIFNHIKESCPKIRKAYVNPKMYKGLNLFMDLSYYNGLFLEHNKTIKDVAIKFYWEYLNRMLYHSNPYFKQNYSKNTIFIPVWSGAWDTKPGTFVYDWKQNLNPISLIFRMIRKNPEELKKWKDIDFIFVGKTGFFRVDFSKFEFRNLVKFKRNLEKLWRREPISDDEEEDGYGVASNQVPSDVNSTSAITAQVIDKIEQSSGIEINDISAAMNKNELEELNKPKIDGSAIPSVPNLRIRTTAFPATSVDMSIAIMAPSEADIVDYLKTEKLINPKGFSKYYSK